MLKKWVICWILRSVNPTWQPSLLRRCSASLWRCEQLPLGCSGGPAARGSRCPSPSRFRRLVPHPCICAHSSQDVRFPFSDPHITATGTQTNNLLAIRLLGLCILQMNLGRRDIWKQLSHLCPEKEAKHSKIQPRWWETCRLDMLVRVCSYLPHQFLQRM